jgi:hypothetical protein
MNDKPLNLQGFNGFLFWLANRLSSVLMVAGLMAANHGRQRLMRTDGLLIRPSPKIHPVPRTNLASTRHNIKSLWDRRGQMKASLVKRTSRYVAWGLASAIGGWQLTYLIAALPFNMPGFVETFIRFCLSVAGVEYLRDPEDMATLALLLYWVIATLFVCALLFVCYRLLCRYRARKPSGR